MTLPNDAAAGQRQLARRRRQNGVGLGLYAVIWLDYCNSLLIELPLTHTQCLQSVQNAAARLIFNLRRCDHITDALISLHWLRVPERIIFQVATLTYRALHGSA